MGGKIAEFYGVPRSITQFYEDRDERIECCCRDGCYGLVLGRYEYDSRCCR